MLVRTVLLAAILFPATVWADSDSEIVAKINAYLKQGWDDNEVKPSDVASDGEWARRVSLDIRGHVPRYGELIRFMEDESADKKAKFVELMLEDTAYPRYWANIWANRLVGRGNNRRGNRGALERWLRRQIYRNIPYDKFVEELVGAEGNVEENGAVAFLASHLNENAVPATSITSRVFLGMQVQCTQCHNHPFNKWKQDQFWSMNAFFRGTRRQRMGMDRNNFGLSDSPVQGMVFFEKRTGEMKATERKFVDGAKVKIDETAQPRKQLAKLITDPSKPYMSKAIVNRMWGHFFGFGFTRPVDDMGPHNPASHPELLEYMAKQFQKSRYDIKRLMRWITLSKAYALTSRTNKTNRIDNPAAGEVPLFSRMYLKNFTAEQLYDSLLVATDADKTSMGEAGERRRGQWLRQFVQTFGTDENDEVTTFNGTIPQALVMMNGSLVKEALSAKNGSILQRVLDAPGGKLKVVRKTDKKPKKTKRINPALAQLNRRKNMPQKITTLYLIALSRKPTEKEMNAIDAVFRNAGTADPVQGLQDVFWALLNSNEFIINH